jgi:hypothetical protein
MKGQVKIIRTAESEPAHEARVARERTKPQAVFHYHGRVA